MRERDHGRENISISHGREVLSQLLWAVYPGALEWVE